MNEKVYLIGAKRSAIGKFMGTLHGASPADVCAQVIRGGFDAAQLADVESVIIGNVVSAAQGQGLARQIALAAGIDQSVPAYSVGMVCGSGMQAISCGVNEIRCGADVVLCGGVEFMSDVPYAATGIRDGKKFGDFSMTDLLVHDGLTDAFSGVHMGITAENIAKECGITREAQDAYAFMSLQRAITAVDSGSFKGEIVPVKLRDRKRGEFFFDTDEHMNRTSTPEKMASLKPAFLRDGTGTVTAANASGMNDGAAFVLLASEGYVQAHGIAPLAEVVCVTAAGCDPQTMGFGPYYAISKLLDKTGVDFGAVDCFEVNEAFAAQALGCYKKLAAKYGVSEEEIIGKTNLRGSGLGLGHPLGATGARIVVTLAGIMHERDSEYGVASLCIGGGMGAALLLKRA